MSLRSVRSLPAVLVTFTLLSFAMFSCDEDDIFVVTEPELTLDTNTIMFSGTIGALGVSFVNDQLNFRDMDSAGFIVNALPDSSIARYHTSIHNPVTGVLIGINTGPTKYIGVRPSAEEFFQYFSQEEFEFASMTMIIDTIDTAGPILDTTILSTDGLEIVYVENDSVTWSTRYGPQPNSSFTIQESEEITTARDNYIVNFSAKFGCTLYSTLFDTLTGNSQPLSNGVYYGRFRQLNNQ